ncbi:MAG: molybdenum cofactor guanylyltransferase [Candidatus Bathyarchaeota archaeon]
MRSAVILAGGSSRRLGYDKGLRALAGKPLVSYAVDALRPLVDEVILVVASDAQRGSYRASLPASVKISVDMYPGGSPLVGLITGLTEARGDYALVTGCDMPFISPGPVELLFSRGEGRDGAVFLKPNGWIEPLLAVYRADTCLPEALRLLRAEDLRIRMVLRNLRDVAYVPASSLGVDPELLFFDADTEERLAEAERLIVSRRT